MRYNGDTVHHVVSNMGTKFRSLNFVVMHLKTQPKGRQQTSRDMSFPIQYFWTSLVS